MREQSQTKMGMKKRLENLCLRGPTFKSEAPGWKHGGACECMATVMLMKESQAVNGEPLVICTLINACYGERVICIVMMGEMVALVVWCGGGRCRTPVLNLKFYITYILIASPFSTNL